MLACNYYILIYLNIFFRKQVDFAFQLAHMIESRTRKSLTREGTSMVIIQMNSSDSTISFHGRFL